MNIDEIGVKGLKYRLSLMPDKNDDFRHERSALLRFMINAAHLNLTNKEEKNYSLLVHTSGKKIDHKADLENIRKIFSACQIRGIQNL